MYQIKRENNYFKKMVKFENNKLSEKNRQLFLKIHKMNVKLN